MASTNKLGYGKRVKSHANTFGATVDVSNLSVILLTVYQVKKGMVLGVMLNPSQQILQAAALS